MSCELDGLVISDAPGEHLRQMDGARTSRQQHPHDRGPRLRPGFTFPSSSQPLAPSTTTFKLSAASSSLAPLPASRTAREVKNSECEWILEEH